MLIKKKEKNNLVERIKQSNSQSSFNVDVSLNYLFKNETIRKKSNFNIKNKYKSRFTSNQSNCIRI